MQITRVLGEVDENLTLEEYYLLYVVYRNHAFSISSVPPLAFFSVLYREYIFRTLLLLLLLQLFSL
jgi:hypothetical protein